MEAMKRRIQGLLQQVLGLDRYLFILAVLRYRLLKLDPRERDFVCFLRMLSEGDNVLDIGANLGVTTVALAGRVKRVFAFEPIPFQYATLEKMTARFGAGRVRAFRQALGDREAEVEMLVPTTQGAVLHGLSHVRAANEARDGSELRFTVSQVRLDSIAELQSLPIKAIKIDVENHEYHVLQGAKRLLRRNRPLVLCELWDNRNRQKCLDFFDSRDYDVMVRSGRRFVEYTPRFRHRQDFLFVPRELRP